MALPTSSFATYAAVGNAEDVSDIIYRVAPTDVPFTSAVDKVKATAVTHEWQTQTLASADTSNAVLEGDDAVTDSTTATVRLQNICQISDKVPRVTGTQQAVDKYGRSDDMDYQKILKGLELKRDMESILLANQAYDAGNATTARTTASVLSWINTNTDIGTGAAADPTGDGTDTRTDGTQRAFTEAQLKTVLSSTWSNGGDPDMIMVGAFNKQVMSSFVGRGTPIEETSSRKIIAAIDVYESDFGVLKIVPNRNNSRARDALVLQTDMWAIAFLRNMRSTRLAKNGDTEREQIICEYALEARNEVASGAVFDLTTS